MRVPEGDDDRGEVGPSRDEASVAADAVWSLIEAGMLERSAATVKAAAAAARLTVDDLRVASLRLKRPPTKRPVREEAPAPQHPVVVGTPGNFANRLRQAVDNAPQTPPQIVAKRLVDGLDSGGHADLVAWLETQANDAVTREAKAIRAVYAGRGGSSPSRSLAVSFAHQAAKFELGQLSALSDFKALYSVNGKAKELGSMTGADHEAVAHGFESLGKTSAFMAAVHHHVGLAVGDKTTEEVFTPESYKRVLANPGELNAAS